MKISIPIPQSSLILRTIEASDAKAFFTLIDVNRKRLLEYFPGTSKANATINDTQKYIQKNEAEATVRKHFCLVIVSEGHSEIYGVVILKNIDWKVPKGELAYMIDQEHSGKGIMTNSILAFMEYAFESLKMIRLYAIASVENETSVNLALRCGMLKEGKLRSEYRSGLGNLRDVYVFGRLSSD